MARTYDIVSRSREYTIVNIITTKETKSGKPSLKLEEARVPFYVKKDNKRDYDKAFNYLKEHGAESIKAVDGVARYVTINYAMPFSDFAAQAEAKETKTKN